MQNSSSETILCVTLYSHQRKILTHATCSRASSRPRSISLAHYSKFTNWNRSCQVILERHTPFHYYSQSGFFDFCAGNRHQIVAGARVKAVKVTPKLLVARVEISKVFQLIGLSYKCGTNYTLCCGLARVRVKSDKIVLKIRLSPKFGACAGRSSENGAENIFPAHYKECSLLLLTLSSHY